jgi:hypothetical protein
MTTQRSPRSVLSLTAILLLVALAAPAFALDEAQFRPQVEKFLADEALPEVELNDRLRTTDANRWPDAGCLAVGLNTHRTPSFVHQAILDEASGAVVGFVAAQPEPPVPMEEMPAEEAIEIAKQFAGRHLPELFADGGEVAVTVTDGITPLGARMVNLQRTVQGVQVPTLADVGVRVYDGKVVYWRRHDVPLAEGLPLPGALALDQAKQIAGENVPYKDHAPVFWFDEAQRVIVTDDGQRNAWELWAAIKLPTTPENRLEFFAHWQIDANTGEVLLSEGINPGQDLELRRRFYAAGGTLVHPEVARPQPEPLFTDRAPTPSDDGSHLLFNSTRPRPGYPQWVDSPAGLFVCSTEGNNLRCIVGESALNPAWSPDQSSVAYVDNGDVVTLDLATGETQRFKPPARHMYSDVVWAGETLVAIGVEMRLWGKLWLLDRAFPEADPLQLPAGLQSMEKVSGLTVDGQGRIVYTIYRDIRMSPPDDKEREKNPYRLCRLDALSQEVEPTVLIEYMDRAPKLFPGPSGRLVAHDPDHNYSALIDPDAGTVEQWEPPSITATVADVGTSLRPKDIRFLSGGERIVFRAPVRDQKARTGPADLIWTCALDGSDVQQVTPWEAEVVPMAE